MPKKAQSSQKAPPAAISSVQATDEWRAKNKKARELILSTIEPGSEAWKIAEPLELASDIWKALEDRYGPHSAPPEKGSAREQMIKAHKEKESAMPEEERKATPAPDECWLDVDSDMTPDEKVAAIRKKNAEEGKEEMDPVAAKMLLDFHRKETKRKELEESQRKEAQVAAARVLAEHMPNRDQRFLWALLHGGKAETMAWFNGTATTGSAG